MCWFKVVLYSYLSNMNASNRELLPLIYRHLKENGFNSAAEELHKHSAQSEPPTSTTLLDIYSSWLKSSKRKTKSTASKPSAQDKKLTTPKKASPQKKKTEKNTKPGSPNKKSPTKRKKDDGKATEKNVKSRKSKVEKKETQGGEDSDSDSSLDVEKWKRLFEQMTDADLAKVEALDALVSPEPKKQRVRKPRAKPNPTAKTSSDQQNKTSDKLTEDTAIKKTTPKKSRSKKVLPVSLTDNSTQQQNIGKLVGDVISPPKQSPKNEKREATTDQATLEPKKKKKKATTNNVNIDTTGGVINNTLDNNKDVVVDNPTDIKITMGSNDSGNNGTKPKKKKKDATQNHISANALDGDSVIDKHVETDDTPKATELTVRSLEKTANHPPEPKKKRKNKTIEEVTTESIAVVEQSAQTNATNTAEDINGKLLTDDWTISLNTANAESIEKAKKKKKKKDKAKEDGEQTVTDAKSHSVSDVEMCDKTPIESSQDIEPAVEISHKKKKKKKDKSKEESETLPQEDVIVETVAVEENTEQIIVKKKSKKKKRDSEGHLGTEGEQITTVTQDSQGEALEETPAPLSPTPPTPGKKKKHKLQSEQLDIADSVPEIQESETPKKKKKKSTKSNESES